MVGQKNANAINTKVQCELAWIRQSWARHKKAIPAANPFSFLANIVATGRIPPFPPRKICQISFDTGPLSQ